MRKEWFYVSSFIGYFRFLLLISFFIFSHPLYKALALAASQVIDTVDGSIARFFKQTSLFGARLDLLADMGGRSLMAFYAAMLFQDPWISSFFILCGFNEGISYFLTLYVCYGSHKEKLNHKKILGEADLLLRLYYSQPSLAVSNVLHDVFVLSLVSQVTWIPVPVLYLCAIGFFFRQCCHADLIYRLFSMRKYLQSIEPSKEPSIVPEK